MRFNFMLMILLLGLVSACGSGSEGLQNSVVENKVTLKGKVLGGLFSGGTVNIFTFEEGDKRQFIESSTISENGEFSVEAVLISKAIILEAATAEFVDPISKKKIKSEPDFVISTVLEAPDKNAQFINITPFTHLATALALHYLESDKKENNIATAIEQINNLFSIDLKGSKLDISILDDQPQLVVRGDEEQALLIVAMAQLVHDEAAIASDAIDESYNLSKLITLMYKDLRTDGLLDGKYKAQDSGELNQLMFGAIKVNFDFYRINLAIAAKKVLKKLQFDLLNDELSQEKFIFHIVSVHSSLLGEFDDEALKNLIPEIKIKDSLVPAIKGKYTLSFSVENALFLHIVEVRLNEFTIVKFLNPVDSEFSVTLNSAVFKEGMHNISIDVSDSFDHSVNVQLSVVFDNTPPIIEVHSSNLTKQNNFLLEGSYKDDYSDIGKILVNEEEVDIVTANKWSKLVSLNAGINNFNIQVQDVLGNEQSITTVVTFESITPNNKFLSAPITNTKQFVLMGEFSGALVRAKSVSVNGDNAALLPGDQWSYAVELKTGLNGFLINVEDQFGNYEEFTAEVELDEIKPVVSLSSVTMLSAGQYLLLGDYNENSSAPVSIEINGMPAEIVEGHKWSKKIFISGDSNLVVVRIEDMAGNYNEISQSVPIDKILATPFIKPAGGSYIGSLTVSIDSRAVGAKIFYTTNGSDPAMDSNLYSEPFILTTDTILKARSFLDGYSSSDVATESYLIKPSIVALIPQADWSIVFVDSESSWEIAENAIDGDPKTNWHTLDKVMPNEIQINLGVTYEIAGFRYLPRQDATNFGNITLFEFYVSIDGINWGAPVAAGEFDRTMSEKEILFPPKVGRYIRLVALGDVNDVHFTAVAEVNVLGGPFPGYFRPESFIDYPGPSGVTVTAGDSVLFQGTGVDLDSTQLTYHWKFGDAAISDSILQDPGLVQFDKPGTYEVTLVVTDDTGQSDNTPASVTINVLDNVSDQVMPIDKWSLKYVDNYANNQYGRWPANLGFDGNVNTYWHTEFDAQALSGPHEIQINLGETRNIFGFRYLPPQDDSTGRVGHYHFYVSADGVNWGKPVSIGSLANDATEKEVLFPPKIGQFIRLVAIGAAGGEPWTSMAELNVLGSMCSGPFVKLISPLSYYLQNSAELDISTSTCIPSGSGMGVKFSLTGSKKNSVVDYTAPYKATFTNLEMIEHVVDVNIVDADGINVTGPNSMDQAIQVGRGDYYVSIGDSITVGEKDNIASDNATKDGRNISGGYTPILSNLLTASKGYPHKVIQEGVSGDWTLEGLQRLPKVLERHPLAQYFLIQFGTNDPVAGLFSVSSGLGLTSADSNYKGTYKAMLQQMIDLIKADGKAPYLAKVPYLPIASPEKVAQLLEYNQVIDELRGANGIVIVAPDFYNHFEMHQGEFHADGIHPDGIGYQSMGGLWFNVIP